MSHDALRNLVTAGELSATLAAQITLLADAGVPIVVTGSAAAERRDALAAAKARKAAGMLKALSHEGRLLILCLLADGERSVSEIETIMDMPQAAVSQQLARLRLDGLVTARRAGRSIYYSTASRDVTRLITSLHQMLLYKRPIVARFHPFEHEPKHILALHE